MSEIAQSQLDHFSWQGSTGVQCVERSWDWNLETYRKSKRAPTWIRQPCECISGHLQLRSFSIAYGWGRKYGAPSKAINLLFTIFERRNGRCKTPASDVLSEPCDSKVDGWVFFHCSGKQLMLSCLGFGFFQANTFKTGGFVGWVMLEWYSGQWDSARHRDPDRLVIERGSLQCWTCWTFNYHHARSYVIPLCPRPGKEDRIVQYMLSIYIILL